MRPNNSSKRLRSRNRPKGGGNALSRSYESNGPDVKIRGSALQVADKYAQLARDSQLSGDRVMAENYFQHAEHYYRIVAAAYEQSGQPQPGPRRDDRGYDTFGGEQPNLNGYDGEDDDDGLRRAIRVNGNHPSSFEGRDDDDDDGDDDGAQVQQPRQVESRSNGNGNGQHGYARDDRRGDQQRIDRGDQPRSDQQRSDRGDQQRSEVRREDGGRRDNRSVEGRRDEPRRDERRSEPRPERRFVPIDAEQPTLDPEPTEPVRTEPPVPVVPVAPVQPTIDAAPEPVAPEPEQVDAAADELSAELVKRKPRAPRGQPRTRRTEASGEAPAPSPDAAEPTT